MTFLSSLRIAAAFSLGLAPALALAANGQTRLTPYHVEVTLSPKAEAKLKSAGEWIHISAMYYGVATKPADGDDMGQIDLGSEETDIETPGTVILGKISVSSEKTAKTVDGTPRLLINVYTSRKKFEDNLIACDIWDGIVDDAQDIKIPCKLIAE